MRLKFFTVPALDAIAAEVEVNRFLAQHRILRVDRQLVSENGLAYWAICVAYSPTMSGAAKAPVKKGKVDYKEVLTAEDFTRYLELRNLRKALSERDGVPAYHVFTNEQLAAMVQGQLRTREQLAALDGVGASRMERYAAPFLDRLHALLPDVTDAPTNAS